MLHASGLPKTLWGKALLHVVWVKNRSATQALDDKTPYEMLYGKKLLENDIVMSSSLFMLITYYSVMTDTYERD